MECPLLVGDRNSISDMAEAVSSTVGHEIDKCRYRQVPSESVGFDRAVLGALHGISCSARVAVD